MAPTYCIVKLFQKATYERLINTLEGHGGSSSSSDNVSTIGNNCSTQCKPKRRFSSQSKVKQNNLLTKCRICLKEGDIEIFNEDGSSDIAKALQVFADIPVAKTDGYPSNICGACYSLLQGAILLRKTAKKTNRILEAKINKELIDDNQDNGNVGKIVKKKQPILMKYFIPVENDDNFSKNKTLVNKKSSKVQCQICYKIITKSYYKEHFSLHEMTPIRHVCDVCGKGFRLKSAYRAHLFTHSTDFPYKCHLCPYRGRYSGLLNTHMRTHLGDYKYKCAECPAKFIYKCNLNKHTLRHKEPMFQCGECKKTYHTRLLVDRHYEVEHLGVKNHICQLCGKAFGYRKAMMRHQLDVHKRKKKVNGRTPSYLEAEYFNENTLE